MDCWSKPYQIRLIKRNSEETVDLARLELPKMFNDAVCQQKGMEALEGDLKEWLRKELDVDSGVSF